MTRKNTSLLKAALLDKRDNYQALLEQAVEMKDPKVADEAMAEIAKIDAALAKAAGGTKTKAAGIDDVRAPDAVPQVKRKSRTIGLGFAPREASSGPDPDNPVAMKASLRREMGDHAADFLDEYGQVIHTKVMDFLDEIMTRALDLGVEDDGDGVNTLRETLRDQIGRRGLQAVEPTFPEWRSGLFKILSKDIKDRFSLPVEEPTESTDVPDAQVEQALGLDAMDDEEAPEAVEEVVDEEEAEEEAPQPEASASAPLAFARAPVSVRVGGTKPVSAGSSGMQSQKATDFVPSGFVKPQLE